MVGKDDFFIELRNIKIQLVLQFRAVNQLVCVGVILRKRFTLFEFRFVFNEICIDDIRRVVIDQPAVNHGFPIAVCKNRLTENFSGVQGRSSCKGNFNCVKIFDDLFIFTHIVILIIVENFFFCHFPVENISSVCLIYDNQIKSTRH